MGNHSCRPPTPNRLPEIKQKIQWVLDYLNTKVFGGYKHSVLSEWVEVENTMETGTWSIVEGTVRWEMSDDQEKVFDHLRYIKDAETIGDLLHNGGYCHPPGGPRLACSIVHPQCCSKGKCSKCKTHFLNQTNGKLMG